jgi:hypothetical protein
MRRRFHLLLCATLFFLPAHFQAQEPALSIIRGTSESGEIQKWELDPSTGVYRMTWSTTSLSLTGTAIWSVPQMAAGDWDGDGLDDLAVIDPLGVSILGEHPLYMPFRNPSASWSTLNEVLLEDVDDDDQTDLVTQRVLGRSPETRVLTVWKRSGGTFVPTWEDTLPMASFVLLAEDVDNDGQKELVSADNAVLIFERDSDGPGWNLAAELPNMGLPGASSAMIDVVRVADVDSDGRNEIMVTGNSGRLTIFKHLAGYPERGVKARYPVFWQSPPLASQEMQPREPGSPRFALTQGLGVADVDCDGDQEILVGTLEAGVHPELGAGNLGRVLQFEFNGEGGFENTWTSEWMGSHGIPGIQAADLDGNGCAEWIDDGHEIYAHVPSSGGYALRQPFEEGAREKPTAQIVFGRFGRLGEPTWGVRLVPVSLNPPHEVAFGTSIDLSLTLRNFGSRADGVTVTLRSEDPAITVLANEATPGSLDRGEERDAGPFRVRLEEEGLDVEEGGVLVGLWADVTTDAGWRASYRLSGWWKLPGSTP